MRKFLWIAALYALAISPALAADLDGLTDAQRKLTRSNCDLQKHLGAAAVEECQRNHVKALGNRTGKPDLSSLTPEDRTMAEGACQVFLLALTDYPDSYDDCLKQQLQTFAKHGKRPDFSKTSEKERGMIEAACANQKQAGPGFYNKCIRDETAKLRGIDTRYSNVFAGIPDDVRKKIEDTCDIMQFGGPMEYYSCVKDEIGLWQEKVDGPAPRTRAERDSRNKPNANDVPAQRGEERPLRTTEHERTAPSGWERSYGREPEREREPDNESRGSGGSLSASLAAAVDLDRPAAKGKPKKAVMPSMPRQLGSEALAPDQLFSKIAPSVYVVLAGRSVEDFKQKREISQGSAVAISQDTLLTNCHVIENRGVIILVQDRKVTPVTLMKSNAAQDRCVLQVMEGNVQPLEGVRPYGDLKVGERVYTIGSPSGLDRTLGEGLVSGLREGKHGKLVQTTAPISPGSSGGGLFDSKGNLIGITTFLLKDAQQLNFAIGADQYWTDK